jgi:hypothetical protein
MSIAAVVAGLVVVGGVWKCLGRSLDFLVVVAAVVIVFRGVFDSHPCAWGGEKGIKVFRLSIRVYFFVCVCKFSVSESGVPCPTRRYSYSLQMT